MKSKCLYIPHRKINALIDISTSTDLHFIKWNKILTLYSLFPPIPFCDVMLVKLFEALNFRAFLSTNWISPTEKLMVRLSNISKKIITITLQHGAYGGLVFPQSIKNELVVKSDVFLVWGPRFKHFFERENPSHNHIRIFGNPEYKNLKKNYTIDAWVIAFSSYPGRDRCVWNDVKIKLEELGERVFIKLHKKDSDLVKSFGPHELTEEPTTSFKGVVTDYSTVVLDSMVRESLLVLYDDMNPINDEIRSKSRFSKELKTSNKNNFIINYPKDYIDYLPNWVELNENMDLFNILNEC